MQCFCGRQGTVYCSSDWDCISNLLLIHENQFLFLCFTMHMYNVGFGFFFFFADTDSLFWHYICVYIEGQCFEENPFLHRLADYVFLKVFFCSDQNILLFKQHNW